MTSISRRNMETLWQQFQTPLSQKGEIIFSDFLLNFWKVHEI